MKAFQASNMTRNELAQKDCLAPLLYLLVFLVVFFSNDTIMFGANMNESFHRIGYCMELFLILALAFTYSFILNKDVLFSKKMMGILIFMVVSASLTAVMNSDIRSGYLGFFFMILIGFLFTERVPIRSFCLVFVRVFVFIAFCSLAGRVITDVIPGILNLGFTIVKPSGLAFQNLVVYARTTEMPAAGINFSFFREPGVFQIYLNIALLLSLSDLGPVKKLEKWAGVVILVLATVLTFSTTGYICMCLILILFVLKNGYFKENKKFSYLFIAFLMVIAALLVYVFIFGLDSITDAVYDMLFSKFDRTSDKFDSGGSRMVSIGTNYYLWLKDPVFGIGITQKQELYFSLARYKYGFVPTSDTNTIFAMFSLFGVMMGIILILAIAGLVNRFSSRITERVIFGTIIVIMLMTEYLVFSALCNIWIWYGLRLFFDRDYYSFADLRTSDDTI